MLDRLETLLIQASEILCGYPLFFLLIGGVVNDSLLYLVLGASIVLLENGVGQKAQKCHNEKNDEDNEHSAVVALSRSLAELVCAELLVLSFKYKVNPF